jgi:hypothetical protein
LTATGISPTVSGEKDVKGVFMSRLWVPLALAALLPLISCQQKDAHSPLPAVVADAKSALVIMADLQLWSIAQDALTFKESIPIGEKLALLGQTEKLTQSGKERTFLHARRVSGSEGWVRSDFVVSNAILAVITTDDPVLYTAAGNTAATTETIPRMTVVAIHADTGGMSFIRITCYDTKAKMLLKGVYLRNEGVSSLSADVQSAILLQLAASSKNAKQREAFLSSAIKDYPESIFQPELREALSPQAPASSRIAVVAASGTMKVVGDAAKVFDAPDSAEGKVLATLPKGQAVEVEEKTTEAVTLGGQTAPWYRIREPSGWVFGAALGPGE